MCGYNGAKLQKKYEIANVLLVFLIIYKWICSCSFFVLVPHPREAFEIHRKIIEMSLKHHRDAVELFYNRCTIVDRLLLDNHSITTLQSLEKSRKRVENSHFFRLEMLQNSRKCTFSAFFSGKLLQVSKRVRTFASQLGHGVMVTLQVLVLSFWVRIPVTQQNALIGCVIDADD